MHSAKEHPEVIQAYLESECAKGRMLGPFSKAEAQTLPALHINRFRVIPKGHNTGKWRLITDLSYPPGEGVNDGISPELCSLTYISVDKVAEVATCYGEGALMAKVDIESAYRLIPVHLTDQPLQAMEWKGQVYVDPMLPFGLRSAPKLFNAIADALEWHLKQRGIQHIFHYLDDFVVVARPAAPDCAEAVGIIDGACTHLGIPIAEHKQDGPTTCLVFLRIEVDTIAAQLRLPADKLRRIQTLLAKWGDKKACSRRELESLVGLLNHACRVVRSGRSFLRRMLELLHTVPMHPSGTTLSASIGDLGRTWHSGACSSSTGMVSHSLLPRHISRPCSWHQMPRAHGVVVCGMAPTGFRCSGTSVRRHCR